MMIKCEIEDGFPLTVNLDVVSEWKEEREMQ